MIVPQVDVADFRFEFQEFLQRQLVQLVVGQVQFREVSWWPEVFLWEIRELVVGSVENSQSRHVAQNTCVRPRLPRPDTHPSTSQLVKVLTLSDFVDHVVTDVEYLELVGAVGEVVSQHRYGVVAEVDLLEVVRNVGATRKRLSRYEGNFVVT